MLLAEEHDTFLDPIREIIPREDALRALCQAMAAGKVLILGVDMQWEYFFAPRLKALGESDAVANTFPKIAQRAHGFLTDLDKTGIDIARIWTVHTLCKSLQNRPITDANLRRELAIKSRPEDTVIGKDYCCPFIESSLDAAISSKKPDVILAFGGVLEKCLGAALITGTEIYKQNIILIPELTACTDARDASYVRAQFHEAAKPSHRGWNAVLGTADILHVANMVAKSRLALHPVH
jgi:hypothetical protein